jgi:hypothetical protein
MNSDKIETGKSDSSMNKALAVEVEAMRELEQQANPIEYKRAQHCKNVIEGDGKYGDHAVETFAAAINWSTTQVYGYAKVAQTWTEDEVRGMQDTKHCTWSHLLILARNSVADRRESLIEKVSAGDLSVQELRKEIKTTASPDPQLPNADYLLDTSPSEALVESLQNCGAKLTTFETDAKAEIQRLWQIVGAAGAEDLTPAVLDQLRQILKRFKAVCPLTKLLEDCVAKAQKANKKAAAPKTEAAAPKTEATAPKTKAPISKVKATGPAKQTNTPATPARTTPTKARPAAAAKKWERSQNLRTRRQSGSVSRAGG